MELEEASNFIYQQFDRLIKAVDERADLRFEVSQDKWLGWRSLDNEVNKKFTGGASYMESILSPRIRLDINLILNNPSGVIKKIMLHEISHIMDKLLNGAKENPHDETWQHIAEKIGAYAEAQISALRLGINMDWVNENEGRITLIEYKGHRM
jgi:hypothetical protein